ncbi:DUF6864 domain-containing function [Paenibacillus sp. YAF4_2]|uniref:DUF6864 domain-containing function n=1 Tax=Paenibacillus sp. YAF4_2 TaxID=3233085 RepID=UPI003F9B37A8
MKIKSGGFEAMYHGRILAYGMNPIEIVLSEESDPLTFALLIIKKNSIILKNMKTANLMSGDKIIVTLRVA